MIDQVSIARLYGTSSADTFNQTRASEASAAAATKGDGDFAAVLGNMINSSIDAVKASEATSAAGVRGQASVQQVVEAVMAAEQSLQSSLAVRDKIVQAYLEISRMQI
ncbi:MAG: flagellar hook-basal body complex protein FliE [Hyphomicrobiaceae bacterium]